VLPIDKYDQPLDYKILFDPNHPLCCLLLRLYSLEVFICYHLNTASRLQD